MGSWEPPTTWAINMDGGAFDENAAYNAGRLEDVIVLTPSTVLAASTS
jgi:hypothetical protein